MSVWLYLLIPVAIVGGIFLGIRFRHPSRRWIVWPISGSLGGPTRTVRDILAATATQGEMVVVVAEID